MDLSDIGSTSAISGAATTAVAKGFSVRTVRDLNNVIDTRRIGVASLSLARAPWALTSTTPPKEEKPIVASNASTATFRPLRPDGSRAAPGHARVLLPPA